MADLKNFKEKLFTAASAAGLEEYELYCQNGVTFRTMVFNGEVADFTNAATVGVSFRGKFGGKIGYAYSEKADDSVIGFLVSQAKENASLIEGDEVEEIYAGDEQYPEIITYYPELAAVPSEDKIATALAVEASCKAADPRVMAVPYCMVGSGEREVVIANSKGLDVSTKSNAFYSYASAQVGEDGMVKTGGDIFIGSNFAKFNPKELGEKVAKTALAKLGAKSIESGKYPIIFENACATDLLGVYVSGFSAETAQKGFSLLKGKLGEVIASPAVSITDDPLLPGAVASTPFDSEGVASYKKAVIDKGVFKTFLHNTKTAAKDGVKPTGNGFKADFKAAVNISPTNFFIEPSDISVDDLNTKMGKGLLITDLDGLHAGTNAISGDFSLSATGFLVEGGKITRPVDQITISGNFFEMLKNIEAVGSDLEFFNASPPSNVASPSFLVKSLDVAGS